MRKSQAFLPLIAATLFLAACGSQDTASSAVSQAETFVENNRANASLYAPEELQAIDGIVADMKAKLSEKDYQAVIADVPRFNTEMTTLKEAVVSGQSVAAAAQAEWSTLNAEVPKIVDVIQARVDSLSTGPLPKEISKATFATAKTDLEALKATWAEATAAADQGKPVEANEKGRTVVAKIEELKSDLGMNPAVASNTTQATIQPN